MLRQRFSARNACAPNSQFGGLKTAPACKTPAKTIPKNNPVSRLWDEQTR